MAEDELNSFLSQVVFPFGIDLSPNYLSDGSEGLVIDTDQFRVFVCH